MISEASMPIVLFHFSIRTAKKRRKECTTALASKRAGQSINTLITRTRTHALIRRMITDKDTLMRFARSSARSVYYACCARSMRANGKKPRPCRRVAGSRFAQKNRSRKPRWRSSYYLHRCTFPGYRFDGLIADRLAGWQGCAGCRFARLCRCVSSFANALANK